MKKTSKSAKRRPRTICHRCHTTRPAKYTVRVVGGRTGKDERFCCVDGYRDHIFGQKIE